MRGVKSWPAVLMFAAVSSMAAFSEAQATETRDRAEPEIRVALIAFLRAFDDLDWPAFQASFAPDATMFHPSSPNFKRIDTPQGFENAWLGVFDRIRKNSGRISAPYMNLQPQDLKIQLLSPDVALVTFHLTEANVLSRRTIVFRHDPGGWKIVHIHASNLNLSSR